MIYGQRNYLELNPNLDDAILTARSLFARRVENASFAVASKLEMSSITRWGDPSPNGNASDEVRDIGTYAQQQVDGEALRPLCLVSIPRPSTQGARSSEDDGAR